jgi:Flp pilus assembly protein TadG/uncharacterized membrane protein (UPF0127 family)
VTDRGCVRRLPEPVLVLDSFFGRLRGAIGRRRWRETAFVLTRTNVVHTWFMPGPIDVAFVDGHGRVVRVVRDLRPWRLSPWVRAATTVVEAAAGRLDDWAEGDRVEGLPPARRRRGQALVEFALVLPLMLLLILGGIDLLTLAGSAGLVATAAQDGANAWAQGVRDPSAVTALVQENLAGGIGLEAGQASVTVTVTGLGGNCSNNGQSTSSNNGNGAGRRLATVMVQVSVPFQFVVPVPSALPDTVTITRSAAAVARVACPGQ